MPRTGPLSLRLHPREESSDRSRGRDKTGEPGLYGEVGYGEQEGSLFVVTFVPRSLTEEGPRVWLYVGRVEGEGRGRDVSPTTKESVLTQKGCLHVDFPGG